MMIPDPKSRLIPFFGLPIIRSLDEFSAESRLSKGFIYRCSKFADHQYFTYPLPKKSGGTRLIAQPSRDLKALQAWILRNILDCLVVSPACKGFEIGSSISQNALPHIGSNAVLSIDLEDFFPSIHASRVWFVFHTIGYSPRIAAILTSICTYKGALPQGSPCSPKLANLVCLRLDARLLGYVGKRGIGYTRYADDLTFSAYSGAKLWRAYKTIQKIILDESFTINNEKTRFSGPSRQHRVTGLVVTNTSVGIGRGRLRELRVKLYQLCTKKTASSCIKEIRHVSGWLAFVRGVDPVRLRQITLYITRLQKKFPGSALDMVHVPRQPETY